MPDSVNINHSFTFKMPKFPEISETKTPITPTEIQKEIEIGKISRENLTNKKNEYVKSINEHNTSIIAIKEKIGDLQAKAQPLTEALDKLTNKHKAIDRRGGTDEEKSDDLNQIINNYEVQIIELTSEKNQLSTHQSKYKTIQKIASFIKTVMNSMKIKEKTKKINEFTTSKIKAEQFRSETNYIREMRIEEIEQLGKKISEFSSTLEPNSSLKDLFKEGKIDIITGEEAISGLNSKIYQSEKEIKGLEGLIQSLEAKISDLNKIVVDPQIENPKESTDLMQTPKERIAQKTKELNTLNKQIESNNKNISIHAKLVADKKENFEKVDKGEMKPNHPSLFRITDKIEKAKKILLPQSEIDNIKSKIDQYKKEISDLYTEYNPELDLDLEKHVFFDIEVKEPIVNENNEFSINEEREIDELEIEDDKTEFYDVEGPEEKLRMEDEIESPLTETPKEIQQEVAQEVNRTAEHILLKPNETLNKGVGESVDHTALQIKLNTEVDIVQKKELTPAESKLESLISLAHDKKLPKEPMILSFIKECMKRDPSGTNQLTKQLLALPNETFFKEKPLAPILSILQKQGSDKLIDKLIVDLPNDFDINTSYEKLPPMLKLYAQDVHTKVDELMVAETQTMLDNAQKINPNLDVQKNTKKMIEYYGNTAQMLSEVSLNTDIEKLPPALKMMLDLKVEGKNPFALWELMSAVTYGEIQNWKMDKDNNCEVNIKKDLLPQYQYNSVVGALAVNKSIKFKFDPKEKSLNFNENDSTRPTAKVSLLNSAWISPLSVSNISINNEGEISFKNKLSIPWGFGWLVTNVLSALDIKQEEILTANLPLDELKKGLSKCKWTA